MRAGGQRHLDFVNGGGAVIGDVALGEGPNLGFAGRLAGGGPFALTLALAGADVGHGVGQYGRRQPGVSQHPVGNGAARPQGTGAFGGKHYRNRLAAPADMAVAAQVIGGIAGQHGAHGDNILPQGAQPGRAQPQVEDGGVAGADAQKGPPAGQLLQRCDGRGHHRRVPGQRVGNGGAQMHALRFQRRYRQGYEQLPEQGLRIGHADVVKADGLGQADVLAEGIVGCGEQGYAIFHRRLQLPP